jgi:maltose alpha-D-glucosyltransferase/alpha-amylase
VAGSWRDFSAQPARGDLALRLARYAREQRWYRSKALPLKNAQIDELCFLDGLEAAEHFLAFLTLELEDGARETYFLPLRYARASELAQADAPTSVATEVEVRGETASDDELGAFVDASSSRVFAETLLGLFRSGETIQSESGVLEVEIVAELGAEGARLEPRFMPFDQSNSTILYGNCYILKLLRKLEAGSNLELEVGRFLARAEPRPNVPRPLAALELRREGDTRTLALLSEFRENQGNAWALSLQTLVALFERIAISEAAEIAPPPPTAHPAESEERAPNALVRLVNPYFALVERLAQRTAELHRALGRSTLEPGFGQEPFSVSHQDSLFQTAHAALLRSFAQLRQKLDTLPEETRTLAHTALALEARLDQQLRQITRSELDVTRIRCHGDYHLGQVLVTGDDFVIIDFEGEPGRSLAERRHKHNPLRDVAGMLRSFAYAAESALRSERVRSEDRAQLLPWAESFRAWVSLSFVRAYLTRSAGQAYCPHTRATARTLLEFFELEKALYEVHYELNNRPEFLAIPLTGLVRIAAPAATINGLQKGTS